jgi:mycothiol system anti-sigma-R factor
MSAWDGTGDCRDAVHRLYHYLDGELDDARRAVIRSHLDECLPCLEAFGFEVELRQVIARKCRDQVPEELRIRITQAIQFERRTVERGDRGIPGV